MSFLRVLSVALGVVLAAAGTAFPPSSKAQNRPPDSDAPDEAPQNVVLMIADGAGPATFTMARDFKRYRQGKTGSLEGQDVRLALDAMRLGTIQTFSEDSRVTDSAAGATAFSTGHKTNNGHVGVGPEGRLLATLLEAAEQRGMATGLVATSRLTHATPASFAAHTLDRWRENLIAGQMLQSGADLMLGGGRRHFLPQSREASEREDDRNLVAEAEKTGYTVVTDRTELDEAGALPLLGLFADGHLPYAIDRKGGDARAVPTLEAMTEKALRLLSQSEEGRKNGVFLMVEGSRIDHAGHNNDAAAHLRETLAYDRAVAAARSFAENDGETLLLSTADHGTGGLSLGRNVGGKGRYAWKPAEVAEVEASHGAMMQAIAEGRADPATVLRRQAGIDSLAADEQKMLAEAVEVESDGRLEAALSEIIGRRAVVGWTTGGHTAVDVGLCGMGPGARRFVGHHDNTYIGEALAELMGFDLGALTAELREGDQQAASAESE